MGKLARQISELVGHIQNALTLWQWLTPIGGGAALAVWAAFEQYGAFLSVVLGLCAFTLLAIASNALIYAYDRVKASSRKVANTLSGFRTAGVTIRNRTIGDDSELGEWVAEWVAEVDKWRSDVDAVITRHFGKAKSDSVFVLDRYDPPTDLPPAYNEQHRLKRNDLSERLIRLNNLIDEISS